MPRREFPPGFFDRADPAPDTDFYVFPRLVTHIDDGAIAAVGDLYDELQLTGSVLDLMGSWVSHFRDRARPAHGARDERRKSSRPTRRPRRPSCTTSTPTRGCRSRTTSFDAAVCCVSVDYLTRPVEVFADVARVLRPGAPFVSTFSNRLFPTKAIRGWLESTDEQHCEIVADYFRLSGGWDEPIIERRSPLFQFGDPLFAVWAHRPAGPGGES